MPVAPRIERRQGPMGALQHIIPKIRYLGLRDPYLILFLVIHDVFDRVLRVIEALLKSRVQRKMYLLTYS